MHIVTSLVAVAVIFYSGLGFLFLRQARRPSCRVCLNRHRCPNRLQGPSRFVDVPVCIPKWLMENSGRDNFRTPQLF